VIGSRPIVAISRRAMPGDPAARIARLADVREWPDISHPGPTELIDLTAGAAVLLCVNGDRIDEPFLAACPDLRLVALASTGYDSIDVAAADRRGVAVTNSRGTLFETTADLTFGLILSARRRISESERYLRAGRWVQDDLDLLLGHDVHGATLGIVGYGEIGRAVARRAAGFGMTILHHRRTRGDDALSRWVELDDLLRESDIVSLHVPMTPDTRHLIGERELRRMKPTATLVNAARGGVVDEAALIRALREGWIGSAGLDVQRVEPNPDPNDPLLGLPNCVVLPHIGSATLAARVAMIDMATDNVVACLEGRPLVTPVGAVDRTGPVDPRPHAEGRV
jgi:lactate dehydrogenase-like 2-hydroxyacid dehydrogenase